MTAGIPMITMIKNAEEKYIVPGNQKSIRAMSNYRPYALIVSLYGLSMIHKNYAMQKPPLLALSSSS